jgi:peptidyl-prolyl cis-trans isomerase C
LASCLAAAAAPPPAAAPAAPAAATGPAAVVNGVPVPEAAVQRDLQRVAPDRRDEARPAVLDYLVENVLIDQHLQQLPKYAVDKKEVDKAFEELRGELKAQGKDVADVLKFRNQTEAELRDEIAAELRWDKYRNEQATDAKLQELFDKEKDLFDGTMVRARHILLTPPADDPKKIEEAKAELRKIKQDVEAKAAAGLAKLPADADKLARETKRRELIDEAFAAAAKEKSQCPSKDQGGDVGSFQRAGLKAEPFSKAAFALQPYQMSDVVTTQFGLHLILATERKAGLDVKFADVKDDVKDEYCGRLREALIAQLKPKATVKINPPPKP